MSKQRVCSNCAYNLLQGVVGKRVLVKGEKEITIGKLLTVKYRPCAPTSANMVLSVQAGKEKIVLMTWNSLTVLDEGEFE